MTGLRTLARPEPAARHDVEAAHGEVASLQAPAPPRRGPARAATGRGRRGRGARRDGEGVEPAGGLVPHGARLVVPERDRERLRLPAQPLDEVGREAARGLEERGGDRRPRRSSSAPRTGPAPRGGRRSGGRAPGSPFRPGVSRATSTGKVSTSGSGSGGRWTGGEARQVGLPLGRGGEVRVGPVEELVVEAALHVGVGVLGALPERERVEVVRPRTRPRDAGAPRRGTPPSARARGGCAPRSTRGTATRRLPGP